jgi:hypothetical protein
MFAFVLPVRLEPDDEGRRPLMTPDSREIRTVANGPDGKVPEGSCTIHPALWCARVAIEVIAVSAGLAALPISVPVVIVVKAFETPGRIVANTVTDGTIRLIGPPITRTVDRVLGYAA